LIGGAGGDSLNGGTGNDTLNARDGVEHNDIVNGDGGVNTCSYDKGDSPTNCS
jgi:Ca2+-binding RTX toxin-like protein